jgi:hypothetical protein
LTLKFYVVSLKSVTFIVLKGIINLKLSELMTTRSLKLAAAVVLLLTAGLWVSYGHKLAHRSIAHIKTTYLKPADIAVAECPEMKLAKDYLSAGLDYCVVVDCTDTAADGFENISQFVPRKYQ